MSTSGVMGQGAPPSPRCEPARTRRGSRDGCYRDAPAAESLAGQPQRAAQLSADGYRFGLISAVSRIRSVNRGRRCDEAGRYWLVVERKRKQGSGSARWPLEAAYGLKAPPADGIPPGPVAA